MASEASLLSTRLPKEAYRDFDCLAQNLDIAEKIDGSINKFAQGLSYTKYADSIADELKSDPALVLSVIRSLANLHMMRSKLDLAPTQLINGVEKLIRKQLGDPGMSFIDTLLSNWAAGKQKLAALVSPEKAIATFQKASSLVVNDENNLLESQCITDIRPVFDDEGDSINAYVIFSQLRLRYHDTNGKHSVIKLALDSKDLKNLKETIERAEKKHAKLTIEAKKLGRPVIFANGDD